MTINFSFVLFFFTFFILTICLLRATMHAIDGPPSWSSSSNVRIILKGLAFWSKVVYIIFQMREVIAQRLYRFCPQEKIMAQKIFWGMGNFSINVSQGINRCDFRVSWSWDLCFWFLKRFGRFEAAASLDAYQITNYQFLQKFIFSFAYFRRIEEKSF